MNLKLTVHAFSSRSVWQSLRFLDVRNNALSRLPCDLAALTSLQSLMCLEGNRFGRFAPSGCHARNHRPRSTLILGCKPGLAPASPPKDHGDLDIARLLNAVPAHLRPSFVSAWCRHHAHRNPSRVVASPSPRAELRVGECPPLHTQLAPLSIGPVRRRLEDLFHLHLPPRTPRHAVMELLCRGEWSHQWSVSMIANKSNERNPASACVVSCV